MRIATSYEMSYFYYTHKAILAVNWQIRSDHCYASLISKFSINCLQCHLCQRYLQPLIHIQRTANIGRSVSRYEQYMPCLMIISLIVGFPLSVINRSYFRMCMG